MLCTSFDFCSITQCVRLFRKRAFLVGNLDSPLFHLHHSHHQELCYRQGHHLDQLLLFCLGLKRFVVFLKEYCYQRNFCPLLSQKPCRVWVRLILFLVLIYIIPNPSTFLTAQNSLIESYLPCHLYRILNLVLFLKDF